MRLNTVFLILISLLVAACNTTRTGQTAACNSADNVKAVQTATHCIGITTYPAGRLSTKPNAVIVYLHGDISRGGPASYLHRYANQPPTGAVSIVMIRPGYRDSNGRRSSGSHHGRRDHYTAENVDAVAGALRKLKRHYKPARLIVLGHSGGAATTAAILGKHPGLVDEAFLISCPCDLVAWRSERRAWTNSLNPSDYVNRVAKATVVHAYTGSNDTNTRPRLAQRYVERLKANGVQAKFTEVPGAGHGFNRLSQAYSRALNIAVRNGS